MKNIVYLVFVLLLAAGTALGHPTGKPMMNNMTATEVTTSVPLTIEALQDGTTIQVNNPKSGMQYSLDGGTTKTPVVDGNAITLNHQGDKVQLYGTATVYYSNTDGTTITGTGRMKVYGNIMSLVDETGFATATTWSWTSNAFRELFKGNTALTDASNLLLPATTLTNYCYGNMFQGCTLLTVAPVLPAETLVNYCYAYIFSNCSNLHSVTCLATDINAEHCTYEWLSNVSDTGTFIKAATTNWESGISGIPEGWTTKNYTPTPVTPGLTPEGDLTLSGNRFVDEFGNIIAVPRLTAKGDFAEANNVPTSCRRIILDTIQHDFVAQDCDTLTGTLASNVKISIANGATVVLDGVTIKGTNYPIYKWAGLNCLGSATIILKDGTTDTIKGFEENYPGIYVPRNKTLIIKGETLGTGLLNASSNGLGAGIGGGQYISCGNIKIQGGTIKATSYYNAASIGGGFDSICGNIIISGGTITANSLNDEGVGIGSGSNGTCGDITISGGTITATGANKAAGIGSSYKGKCGAITIENTVTSMTATKGGSDAPNSIGAGNQGTCGTVTIGDTVYWDETTSGSGTYEYKNGGDTYLTPNTLIYQPQPQP